MTISKARMNRNAALLDRGKPAACERVFCVAANKLPRIACASLRWAILLSLFFGGWTVRAQVVTDCTQAALEEALASGGYVTFECDGSIMLTNTILISSDTTLDASGHFVTISTVSGTNTTNAVRLFEVEPDVSFEIVNLKLADGRSTNGAAIFNRGFLTATSCVFSNNQALGFNGRDGANGRDNATDVAGTDGRNGGLGTVAAGGAVYNIGQASFSACSFLTNAAGGGNGGIGGEGGDGFYLGGDGGKGGRGGAGYGGAIFNGGDLSVSNCTFNFNFVIGGDGSAGGSGGNARTFIGANGVGAAGGVAQGGAIYNATTGAVSVVGSTFALNQSQGGNSADGGNGFVRAPAGQVGGQGAGGAVFNYGTSELVNCTFFANVVSGGAGGAGSSGSFRGGRGGNGGAAWGGGVYNYRRLAATNCTFSDGGTIGGTNGAGGAGAVAGQDGQRGITRGANLANARGTFYLKNCVIAYASPGTNGYGRFADTGYNLSSDRSMVFRGAGSLVNTNPLLGILADNGAPTHTIALQAGSPAIDRGDPTFCFPTDQREVARPVGPRCDIGAYEFGVFLTAPTIVAQPRHAEVQVGGTVTFTVVASGDPPLLYQWRHNEAELPGETEATLLIVGADAANAGTYDVIVSNNSGSVTSEGATLDVLESVMITSDPISAMVTPGATAVFSVTAEGDAPLSYQWLFNGSPILGATLDTLTIGNAQVAQAGSYQVVVSNPFSSVTSLPATLTIATAPPSFITEPANQTVSAGQSATFSASVNGTPPLRYLWFFNQTTLISQTQSQSLTASLTITNAQPTDAGTYWLVVTNVISAITSAPFALNVQTVPPTITQQPTNLTVGTGESAIFSVTVSGNPPPSLQWLFNGTNVLSDGTNAQLTITNAQLTNIGNYQVVITNVAGAITSNPALLLVVDVAPTNVVITPAGATNAVGARVTFSASASGSRPLTFQWLFDGALIVNETNSTLVLNNVAGENAGSYAVEAANAFGTSLSAPAILVIPGASPLLPSAFSAQGLPAVSGTQERRRRKRGNRGCRYGAEGAAEVNSTFR
jgi:hypothetical protein